MVFISGATRVRPRTFQDSMVRVVVFGGEGSRVLVPGGIVRLSLMLSGVNVQSVALVNGVESAGPLWLFLVSVA